MTALQTSPMRLVVVSNRGPYRFRWTGKEFRAEKTVGGLATTLLPMLEKLGGVWIAWGEPGGRHPNAPGRPPVELRYVELSREQVEGYYHGLSNSVLWPLCHYFLARVHLDETQWEKYEQVNRLFAQIALEEAREQDLVWVHDYHLARVPAYLRHERPAARLAFFWHIPFPAPEMFRVLPWRRPILEGLLSCDLVGFHVPEYAKNFAESAADLVGAQVDGEFVRCVEQATQVIARPIGIDRDAIDREARSSRARKHAQELRETLRGQTLVFGVERMDYTKGIVERLRGVERLLELKPEWQGKFSLIQIATPSREGVEAYREKKREIDEIVGRVNGRFSTDQWVPIRYLNRSFSFSRLMGYYLAADVALVTPLRDGLNLVAKEYVASRLREDGVLILSEFTGASEQLPEALLVNPYDVEDMARTLEQALKMPKEEQRQRMQAMRSRVRAQDVQWWAREFLDRLAKPQGVAA